MSFNEIDLFLFEKFFSSKSDSKFILSMIQIHFNQKVDKAQETKILNRLYDLPYIIQNYLFYQLNEKIELKRKYSIVIDGELYSKLLASYNDLINKLLTKFNFNKVPYNYFSLNSENATSNINNIYQDKNKVEFFFHVILNYSYYIIFVHKNQNYKTCHNLIPIIFKNNQKDLSSLLEQNSMYINDIKYKKYFTDFIVKYFIKYYKKYPLIMSSLNQLSLEILIHILIEYYSLNKSPKISKFYFLFKLNKQQVFRTLMLFNDKNSHIDAYKKFTNYLLSYFITKSPENILFIIKMFNIQGIDEETSLKIFLSMYNKNLISNEHSRIKNLFCYLIEIILYCIKIKNKILTKFMINACQEICLSYSFDTDINNIYIFESFCFSFLQKFGIKINFENLKLNYINNITQDKNKNKNSIINYIGKRMNDYLCMCTKNLEIILKKSFEHIFNTFDKGFLFIFDILNMLNDETKFYYMNVENENVKNYRKNIFDFIGALLGYCDEKKMAKEIYKYYFRPNYFWLKKNIKYNISYLNEKEKPGIKIELSKKLNFLNLCNYYSSDEYQTKVLNSIQNIFSSIPPFNNLRIQAAILENYLEELNEENDMKEKSDTTNIKEKIIELPTDIILTEEDENDLRKYLDKISLNSIKYKEKIIYIVLENLSKETNDKEELALISNPTKILYLMIKILSAQSSSDNDEILINCIECVYALHKIGRLFFDYEDEIKYISLIKEIKSKKEYELNQNLLEKMNELLKELLTNAENKNKDNIIINENNSNLGEEDKIIMEIINNCKNVDMKLDKFELLFNLKKLYNDLDTSPNTNKARKINPETIKSLINYLNTLLLNRCFNDDFMSENVLKTFRNLFLSIKSGENLRKIYLNLIQENLINFITTKKYISEKQKSTKIEASSKIFELFIKIIKKLRYKSYLIGKDILKILFEVFENYQKGKYVLTPFSIVSCISICAYLVEYCHQDINQYISIIVRTGINFLKSKSSTIEQQRASAFLLYKILDSLNDQELDVYSKEIFDACNIMKNYANDNKLLFYLDRCLNYYT